MRHSNPTGRLGRLLFIPAIALLAAACGSAATTAPAPTTAGSAAPTGSALAASPGGPKAPEASPSPTGSALAASPSGSQAPEPSGATTSGDVPDNAVFLTFHGTNPTFSIQYVEGWQVTPQPDGVVIRDKDSSETVAVVARQADVAGYVAGTDLPALRAQAGFGLIRQDTVKVGGASYVHLAFHLTSPPDAVTGKQVPLTVDRYYVPGSSGLAIVSLATPDGVDNVDAFRQMIDSFRWS
jgi:hypothetical protein